MATANNKKNRGARFAALFTRFLESNRVSMGNYNSVQLAQNKASASFLIEFFHAFLRPFVHFRTPAFYSTIASANRTLSTHHTIQAGAPIPPYTTESKSLNMIEANKTLIGTQNHSRETLTSTNQTTSQFLIGTKNGLFSSATIRQDFGPTLPLASHSPALSLPALTGKVEGPLVSSHCSTVLTYSEGEAALP